MARINRTTIRKIGIPLLVISFGVAGILPGWLLIVRSNSDEYWRRIAPELVQMDSDVLNDMIYDVQNNDYGVYSILVVRNGFLVTEWYDQSFHKEHLFQVFSVSKSVTSALIGIAVEKRYINNLSVSVVEFFPDKDIAYLDPQKESITIEHLLTMTTGLHWPEYYPYGHPENPYWTWKASSDHVEFVLNRTMIATPGQEFNYNTGATHLLTAILERVTNMTTMEFATRYLFGPLSIEESLWAIDPQGIAGGGDGLFLNSRDMAKIGYLFLKRGKWEGKQIISENWVRTSTSSWITFTEDRGYGYQWWTYHSDNCYRALGYGGQAICVFYNLDLVVVFTGMNLNRDNPSFLLDNYILPATM